MRTFELKQPFGLSNLKRNTIHHPIRPVKRNTGFTKGSVPNMYPHLIPTSLNIIHQIKRLKQPQATSSNPPHIEATLKHSYIMPVTFHLEST